jgi:UPF0042 nucleotide-binding protein
MGGAGEDQGGLDFLIVTGMSGAGRTTAVRSLEDLGYFCVDNLPPTLIPKFAELCLRSADKIRHIALVVDLRGGEFFESTFAALGELEEAGVAYRILFLEADDETLLRRFKETRRRHPLAAESRVQEGIAEERRRLGEIRGRAHSIIDTSRLTPLELRTHVIRHFGPEGGGQPVITVLSFGFKFGLPMDADLVFDVRFLPNPQYVDELRRLDGADPAVSQYIFKWPVTASLMRRLSSLLDFLLPHYLAEGKTQLVVAIGCTGGQHRSVAVAERLAATLRGHGHRVVVEHRDVARHAAATEPAPRPGLAPRPGAGSGPGPGPGPGPGAGPEGG